MVEQAEESACADEHARGGGVEGDPRLAEPVVEDDEGAGACRGRKDELVSRRDGLGREKERRRGMET
jgi:hypothetical protein